MSTAWLIIIALLVAGALGHQLYAANAATTRPNFIGSYLTIVQIKILAISTAIVFVAFLMFNVIFPNLSDAYYERGGPGAMLLLGVIFLCLGIFFIPDQHKGIRKWVGGTIGIVMGIGVLTALLPAIFAGKPLPEEEVRLNREKAAIEARYHITPSRSIGSPCTARPSPSITFVKDKEVRVNSDGECMALVQYKDEVKACYYVKSEGEDVWQGPVGRNCPTRKAGIHPVDIEYVKAVDTFKGRIVLEPRQGTQLVRWK